METKMKELTEKQSNVLDFIKKFTATHGYPPSIREIGKGLNLSSPATVHTHVKNLCKAGYLKVYIYKILVRITILHHTYL